MSLSLSRSDRISFQLTILISISTFLLFYFQFFLGALILLILLVIIFDFLQKREGSNVHPLFKLYSAIGLILILATVGKLVTSISTMLIVFIYLNNNRIRTVYRSMQSTKVTHVREQIGENYIQSIIEEANKGFNNNYVSLSVGSTADEIPNPIYYPTNNIGSQENLVSKSAQQMRKISEVSIQEKVNSVSSDSPEIQHCIICYGSIDPEKTLNVVSVCCDVKIHYSHAAIWLQKRSACPYCSRPMYIQDLSFIKN